MSRRVETINGYTVHFATNLDEVLVWLRDNFGPKAQLVSYLARRDIFTWASEIDDNFDGKQYLPSDIIQIINSENAKALKKMNPLFLQYVKNELTEKQTSFLANNLTAKQICRLPSSFFSKFYPNDFASLINTIDGVKFQPYIRVYTLKKTMAEDPSKTTFVRVETGPIGAVLASKQRYANTQGRRTVTKNVDKTLNFNLQTVTDVKLAAYLGMTIQYFRQLENRHKDSAMMKYMGLPKLDGSKHYFMMKDFKKYMQAVYVPSEPERKNDPEYYLPTDGLYAASDLISMYGVAESNNIRSINRAMRIRKLGFFNCSDRVIRISKKDFEEYLGKREEYAGMNYITKVFNRKVIQYPKKATPEQKAEVLSQYISEDDLGNIISTSDKVMGEGRVVNQYISMLRKELMNYCDKYIDRDNANKENRALYFKREDVQKFFDEKYGYYKKTDNGIEVIPVPLKLSELIEHFENGEDKSTYHMYPLQEIISEYDKEYPNVTVKKIQWKIEMMYRKSQLPIMYLSRKTKYFYKPHLDANEEFIRYLTEKNQED